MIAFSGACMRVLAGRYSIHILWLALCATALLQLPQFAAAQSAANTHAGDTRGLEDYAPRGQVTIQIQDTTGAPFFEGATVTLLTREIETKLFTTSDQSGRARFTDLPVGMYSVEIAAAGYRTIQEQVLLSGTREDQTLVVSLVPAVTTGAKVKIGSVSASPKAVKEAEKALRALQLNRLEEAQGHLARTLALDPNFADGNYLMGLLLIRQKQPSKAADYLQKALKLSPEHTAALLALGEAQFLDHDYSQALASLEQFLQEETSSPQAPVAQKYVDLLRERGLGSTGGAEIAGKSSDPSSSGPGALSGGATIADADLPPLPDVTPVTEVNWAPPDVDAEKLELDSNPACQLNQVLLSTGSRVQELVQNVDRFTATEEIEHSNVSPMGLQTSHETRKFNYLVEIHKIGTSDLDVQEYRSGSVATQDFPGKIATVGLPALALVFHPYLQARYEFRCEGRGSWHGHAAWVVHFDQRADRASDMLTYHVGNRFVAVGLKGRAWIDVGNSQILAMESDLMHPAPEIRLSRDHQLIEYGPVSFRNKSLQLWLPKSADWYCSISGRRFHRRHSFSQYLLFSVDDKQNIRAPTVPVTSETPQ
ncbi:MAG: carboxypeptidase regulatory-like domain-containing protein [Candidatus Acidiferrum sp.]